MKPNNVFQDQSKVQTVLHCLTHTKKSNYCNNDKSF